MKVTKKTIIEAAIEIFNERGKHGARMEEIAIKAEVNKAMVYYYFSSKDNLFKEVVTYILTDIYDKLSDFIKEKDLEHDNPEEVIKNFVMAHFSSISYQSKYSKILIEALVSDSEEIRDTYLKFKSQGKFDASDKMISTFNTGVKKGIFRDIDYSQIMVSIIGMNLVYFITKPIAQNMLCTEVQSEEEFLKKREESIIDLLFNGIRIKK